MDLFETDCVQTINDKPFELQLQTFELKEEEQKTGLLSIIVKFFLSSFFFYQF